MYCISISKTAFETVIGQISVEIFSKYDNKVIIEIL